jgi:hypothetical protein
MATTGILDQFVQTGNRERSRIPEEAPLPTAIKTLRDLFPVPCPLPFLEEKTFDAGLRLTAKQEILPRAMLYPGLVRKNVRGQDFPSRQDEFPVPCSLYFYSSGFLPLSLKFSAMYE